MKRSDKKAVEMILEAKNYYEWSNGHEWHMLPEELRRKVYSMKYPCSYFSTKAELLLENAIKVIQKSKRSEISFVAKSENDLYTLKFSFNINGSEKTCVFVNSKKVFFETKQFEKKSEIKTVSQRKETKEKKVNGQQPKARKLFKI